MLRNTSHYILAITIISTLLMACGGNKKIVYQGEAPDRTQKELIIALQERNIDFDWFASRASAKIKSPQENVSGTVYLRVKKDSIIWMVFKKYSAEASRMLITPDSFYIIHRLKNTYEKGSIEDLENAFNVDFSFADAQQLAVGNSLLPDTSRLETSKNSPHYLMKGHSLNILLSYWINGFDMSLEKLTYEDDTGRSVEINYSKYKILEGIGRIPYLREYDVPVEDNQRAHFKLDFKEIAFEKPPRTIFRIPDHYKQIN